MSTALLAQIRDTLDKESWPKRYSTGTKRQVGANAAAWHSVLENPADSNVVAVATRVVMIVIAINNHNTYSIRLHPCRAIGGGAYNRRGISYRGDECRDGGYWSQCYVRDRIVDDGGAATAITATSVDTQGYYFAGVTSAGITAAGLNSADIYEMLVRPASIETSGMGIGIYTPGLQSTAYYMCNYEWLEIEKRVWDRYPADEWLRFLEGMR